MPNQELAKILYEIGDFLDMEKIAFKPYAYQKAAITLDTLEKDVAEIYKEGGIKALEKIPGVGKSIAKKIEEYIKTGKIKYYEQLKKKMPVKVEELTAIEGIGPKTVKALYKYLKIKDLQDLEKAARQHKIRKLPGFQEKTEQNILEGIAFLKRSKGRFLLGDILPKVKEILGRLRKLKEVEQISVAGSVRRMKETIGDVDILVVAKKPEKVMDFFVSMPGIEKIWGKGPTRSSIRTKQGFDIDLRVVPKKSYGSALQYFTGSKEHNIVTRRIAIEKGLKLNEYGLFRGRKMIAGKTEKEVYKALGMDWMEPELRENRGEIEASLEGKLPKIIGYNDIKGDLHCHSKWNGGNNTIEEMAEAAIAMGYEYLGITDHTKFLKIEHGLNENQLAQQRREIDKLNKRFRAENYRFQILQGAETNILNDGSIDINDEALKKLDYAIAGIHSNFKMSKEKMTERIIKAMKNPYIKIISHPTGRILKKRNEYQCDFDKILRAAKQFGIILEINSQPQRLDLNDQNIRQAREMGIKMVINTDSHYKGHLRFMELGIAQARRGWARRKDIINTYPLEKMLGFLKPDR
ncbi:MAG: DNA polymerase/3'-5' exonuclease PolX [Candidatus Aenigmatarchaeota archaeon]|nr:MAG: DNA polymerase/3'-5' exonuclease PolX [Candidatus Aenigmarchaeota archaeon]